MMISNEPMTALIATFECAARDDEFDIFESILAIKSLLSDSQYRELCDAYDICPMHDCDIEICIDDDILECAELRN